jgi:hypothetical protein
MAYNDYEYGIPRDLRFHPIHSWIAARRRVAKASAFSYCKSRSGALIRGGGGIRKLRFALPGTGKSGGTRIIYYWIRSRSQIYLLMAYPKSKKDNLSAGETAILRDIVKEF